MVPPSEQPAAVALEKIRNLLAQDQPGLALLQYQRSQRELHGWQLPAGELVKLIRGLATLHDADKAVPLMCEYLRRFPEGSARMRLMLAQVLVRDAARPAQALAVMSKLAPDTLPKDLLETRKQIELEAHLKLAGGAIEPAVEDW